MATGQQTFTLGEELKGAFRRFCEDQGFDSKLVFLAGWRALDKAEKEPRKRWFAGLAPWQAEIMEKWGNSGSASKTEARPGGRKKREATSD